MNSTLNSTTTIVLADSQEIVRQGIRRLLEEEPGFSVVGDSGDGSEAVQLVERSRPDALVVELVLPGLGGLEVTELASRRSPTTKTIVLSTYADEGHVVDALASGASAYVTKEATAAELIRAIRAAVEGRTYLSGSYSEREIESLVDRAKRQPTGARPQLTRREREVLVLAAEGMTSIEIAGRLGISPRTAETHRANILRKLGLRGQTDLVRYAIRNGVLPLEPTGLRRRGGEPESEPVASSE